MPEGNAADTADQSPTIDNVAAIGLALLRFSVGT